MAKLVTIIKRMIFVVVPVTAILISGFIANIVKLTHCDFKPPYKAEICRGAGIIIIPVGIVEGFITIKDGAE